MKKRTNFFAAILFLISINQPLIVKNVVFLSTFFLIPSLSKKAQAESALDYFDSGKKKIKDGDSYGAISDYNKAIKMNELSKYNLAASYYNRGKAKNDIKDYKGALYDFNEAIELNPNVPDFFIFRGNVKSRLDSDEYGAISDYNKAIDIDPLNLLAIKNRGISKKILGDDKGACSDWEKASSLGYKDSAKWVRDEC